MVLIRKSCFCFAPRTGTAILGCIGILLAVLSMVPNILLLQDHEFYLGEFVKKQRAMGGKGYDLKGQFDAITSHLYSSRHKRQRHSQDKLFQSPDLVRRRCIRGHIHVCLHPTPGRLVIWIKTIFGNAFNILLLRLRADSWKMNITRSRLHVHATIYADTSHYEHLSFFYFISEFCFSLWYRCLRGTPLPFTPVVIRQFCDIHARHHSRVGLHV